MDINFLNKQDEKLPARNDKNSSNKSGKQVKSDDKKSEGQSGTKNKTANQEKTGGIVGVDLMPSEMRDVSNDRRSSLFSAFSGITVIVVLIGIAGQVLLSQNLKKHEQVLAGLDADLAAITDEKNSLKEKKAEADTIMGKISTLEGFLKYHVYWTKFLKELEGLTLPEVFISDIVADVTSIKMTVVAPDFNSAAKQFYYFSNADFVRDYTLSAIQSKDQEIRTDSGEGLIARRSVTYDLILFVDPQLFLASEKQ